ncbi:hypothetical protein 2AV2_8 [Nodularia phage vB_NpeS-2AV2]|jgi:hypothetical protein|uniref:Uncharacterized protein n=1 Tax=Nodularia phage vB_NpeS-2AV2 TaxID=1777122 RepID=A0A1L2BWP4_9CAUD|nr:hypothetical protein HWA92_gp008 [Nodularia phage vB_NpeS-2AV2]ALY07460.1 hypothetical protein 2AV2_8 [Nodularia phage vB_NpeS-2AV2]
MSDTINKFIAYLKNNQVKLQGRSLDAAQDKTFNNLGEKLTRIESGETDGKTE